MNTISSKKYEAAESDGCVLLKGVDNFLPSQIFDCGQCFRFYKKHDGSYIGVAKGKYIEVDTACGDVILKNCTLSDYDSLWRDYFDIDFDYKSVIESYSYDETLTKASRFAYGIRILHQDEWETLCSFIISQNNNIPRIKGIIEAMSHRYGKKIYTDSDGKDYYSFPDAKTLYEAGEEEIFDLRVGFRAKYIFDAAKKVATGEIDLTSIYDLDTAIGAEYLMKIKGVGIKVAACVLLFAYKKYDAFPKDVWVKRILSKYYSEDIESSYFGKYAGIAQQYLFYYERCKNGIYLK